MATEKLIFEVVAKTGDAVKGFDQVGKSAKSNFGSVDKSVASTKSALTSFGKALGGAAVAGAVVSFGKKAISAASDLAESQSKVRAIFKDSSAEILKWSRTSATALGQSQLQALDAASAFAGFGKAAGLSGSELTKFSTSLTQLATDLASFHNTSVGDAIQAIRSGLSGESEPLKRYNIMVQDATLRQVALSEGIIKSNRALTQQEKVLAVNAALFQQTSDAQGDFARTSGGFAGQQKILSAKLNDLTAQFGQNLLPAAVNVTSGLVDLTDAIGPAVAALGGVVSWAASILTTGIPIPGGGKGNDLNLSQILGAAVGSGDNLPARVIADALLGGAPETMRGVNWLQRSMNGNGSSNLHKATGVGSALDSEFLFAWGVSGGVPAARPYHPGTKGANWDPSQYATASPTWDWGTAKNVGGIETMADAVRDVKVQTDGATASVQAHARAQDELANKAKAATDALLAQWSSALQLETAQDQLQDATKAYADALKTKDIERQDDAFRDLKASVLSVAEAAAQAAEDGLGPMATEAEKAQARSDAMKQSMLEAAAGVAPGSPAYYQIMEWIALLGQIPNSVMTKIGSTFVGKGQQVIGRADRVELRAAGGPVVAGSPYIVGERGPELFVPGRSGTIIPNGTGMGGITVIVNGSASRSDADAVVDALNRWARSNGRSIPGVTTVS